jgi:chromosome segregation ATPase
MEQLDTLKKEIAEVKNQISIVNGNIETLQKKHGEIAGKLSKIDAEVSAVEEKQKAAITRFARGEISEDDLDEFQVQLFTLKGKKKSFAGAIAVIDKDLEEARKTLEPSKDLLKRKTESAWRLVRDLELSKAAVFLRRAFVANGKSGASSGSKSGSTTGFCEHLVYDATFIGIDPEVVFRQATEDLSEEHQI